jgi:hypothetical protein
MLSFGIFNNKKSILITLYIIKINVIKVTYEKQTQRPSLIRVIYRVFIKMSRQSWR